MGDARAKLRHDAREKLRQKLEASELVPGRPSPLPWLLLGALVGSLLGAVALYFMDPMHGQQRRDQAMGQMRDAMQQTRQSMDQAGQQMDEGVDGMSRQWDQATGSTDPLGQGSTTGY